MHYLYGLAFFTLAVLCSWSQIQVGNAADYADTSCSAWTGSAGWLWQQDRPVDTLPVQVSRDSFDSPGISVMPEGGVLEFRFLRDADLLAVRSPDGRAVWSKRIGTGTARAAWDLNDDHGRNVKSGIYIIDVTFSDGSRATLKVCVFQDQGAYVSMRQATLMNRGENETAE